MRNGFKEWEEPDALDRWYPDSPLTGDLVRALEVSYLPMSALPLLLEGRSDADKQDIMDRVRRVGSKQIISRLVIDSFVSMEEVRTMVDQRLRRAVGDAVVRDLLGEQVAR